MSMMVSFVLSFFPRDVLDEILNLIESVSEDFPSYSFKLVALIALATAPRAQTLVSMDIERMLVRQNQVIFTFPHLLETSREGHSYILKIEHYKEENLCAMHTLLHYIKVTETKRRSSKVIISYVTFKEVSTSTIVSWLKSVLKLSGICTETFKAHSYRSASVSAAFDKGAGPRSAIGRAPDL